MNIETTRLVRDEGSVVLFEGVDDRGNYVTYAADHRHAQDIADALGRGEHPLASVPDWAVTGGRS